MHTVPLPLWGTTPRWHLMQPASPGDTALLTNKAQVIRTKSWAHYWKRSRGTRLRNSRSEAALHRACRVTRAGAPCPVALAAFPLLQLSQRLCSNSANLLALPEQVKKNNPPRTRANLAEQERGGCADSWARLNHLCRVHHAVMRTVTYYCTLVVPGATNPSLARQMCQSPSAKPWAASRALPGASQQAPGRSVPPPHRGPRVPQHSELPGSRVHPAVSDQWTS